ncbi:nitrogen regulation protein NR(II) [Lacibacterium aquatile]|uniref:histidine kinase n=1 Tax=Lacibacterium aquatile TaxID=1168082 RepID=A0ABW5DRG2_9PROT
MSQLLQRMERRRAPVTVEALGIVNALPHAVFVVDGDNTVTHLNLAGENLFKISAQQLLGQALEEHVPPDSPLFDLIDKCRRNGASLAQYGVRIDGPRIQPRNATVEVAPIAERPEHIVVAVREGSIASKIDQQLTSRGAARSVSAMAEMLAHEVKNPLSGIRGAAQLLEQSAASDGDRILTRLIVDEVDRIKALIDRMEVFSDSRPPRRDEVNIHQVLEHVRTLAQSGFANRVRFIERYDPSLPPVWGNRDQLVQIFLNLVKNAAEAVPANGGEIAIETSYHHGVRLAVPGSDKAMHLPLLVSIIDNGDGIPEDLRPHLFDPFVTSKTNGTGLGLALVAKIVGDHGGVIEFDSQPRRTVFKVHLPIAGTSK